MKGLVTGLVTVNLAVRFALEFLALAALVAWGVSAAGGVLGWLLGFGAAAVFALLWGVFVSPKARVELAPGVRLAVELTLFGAAAVALGVAGWSRPAVVFVVVAVVSGAVNRLGQSV